jgi:hypothetical protein
MDSVYDGTMLSVECGGESKQKSDDPIGECISRGGSLRTMACENDELAVLKGEIVLCGHRVLKWHRTARSEQPRVEAVDGLGVSRLTPILQRMEKACLRYI